MLVLSFQGGRLVCLFDKALLFMDFYGILLRELNNVTQRKFILPTIVVSLGSTVYYQHLKD